MPGNTPFVCTAGSERGREDFDYLSQEQLVLFVQCLLCALSLTHTQLKNECLQADA